MLKKTYILIPVIVSVISGAILFYYFEPVDPTIITEEDEKILVMFHEHQIYQEFKEMYPNSTESFTPYRIHHLEVHHTDNYNNTLVLDMIFDKKEYHYAVMCDTERNLKIGGGTGIEAFSYLENNDCLQE